MPNQMLPVHPQVVHNDISSVANSKSNFLLEFLWWSLATFKCGSNCKFKCFRSSFNRPLFDLLMSSDRTVSTVYITLHEMCKVMWELSGLIEYSNGREHCMDGMNATDSRDCYSQWPATPSLVTGWVILKPFKDTGNPCLLTVLCTNCMKL